MKCKDCGWCDVKHEIVEWGNYCDEHYYCKEAFRADIEKFQNDLTLKVIEQEAHDFSRG